MLSYRTKWVILGLCFLSHTSENIFFQFPKPSLSTNVYISA